MQLKMKQQKSQSQEIKDSLRAFIKEQHDPNTHYTFDSERGSGESEICREDAPSKDCLKLKLDSKKMFEAMQDEGFFCALPSDPERTYMHCKPLPRN
ncbi:hypothetical protein CPB83DRAFT_845314 [Crepidotus variabilis]|uniref:Uncharacterized protein n=1 Tax=Crepidotus variabilis TaxID=179855 RepID=A0A9P6ERB9_9AGAR|nr:hypothetical protein CPB83DRAFT_845314 [Crepidotus variabilis]